MPVEYRERILRAMGKICSEQISHPDFREKEKHANGTDGPDRQTGTDRPTDTRQRREKDKPKPVGSAKKAHQEAQEDPQKASEGPRRLQESPKTAP